jgi:glucoamylase
MKPYNNNAVVGNGSMLGCISQKGELIRLYWPHIDYPQHIERFKMGINTPGSEYSTLWLEEDNFKSNQKYLQETNILETEHVDFQNTIKIEQLDFCTVNKNTLIRKIKITNTGQEKRETGFFIHSSGITTSRNLLSSLFDFDTDSLIHYRHGYYMGISLSLEIKEFQLGHDSLELARKGTLGGFDSIGMMPDGAVYSNIGEIKPGESKEFSVFITLSDSLNGLKEEMHLLKKIDTENELKETDNYWKDFLHKLKVPGIKDKKTKELYKRSILVFALMADRKSGGLLASPEIDEGFSKCGRYAYCWGRDAAFITEAMDITGMYPAVDRFYDWAFKTQNEDGSWHQRYYMDGNLAPSWGLQVDETGTLLFGIMKHYEEIKDKEFLKKAWESVKKACGFLIRFKDKETGLSMPSYDLWEERYGEHSYSTAAVYGGLKAASEIAGILGHNAESKEYKEEADKFKCAAIKNLWSKERGHFLRSIRVKMNPWGMDSSPDKVYIMVNSKGYYRDFTKEDPSIDISLLGLSIPFGMIDIKNEKMKATALKVKEKLDNKNSGGILRYENDDYAGGNPWILTTLWLAMYYIETNKQEEAKKYLDWVLKGATHLGLLPEQVEKNSGKPHWVIPLTWSHAMFIITVDRLLNKGLEI